MVTDFRHNIYIVLNNPNIFQTSEYLIFQSIDLTKIITRKEYHVAKEIDLYFRDQYLHRSIGNL